MSTLPDWLQPTWEHLRQMIQQDRLPHALLISGPEGLGKHLLADRLTAYLLCEQPGATALACGECNACNWLRSGAHPDLVQMRPEEAGKAIKIDQVRKLGTDLEMTSHSGRYKIAVIQPAEAMNVNAANSLLKTLEEPTANTLLVLLTATPEQLPATIRSRCQQIRMGCPSTVVAKTWLVQQHIEAGVATRCLAMSSGAPLKALALAGSDSLAQRDSCLADLIVIYNGQQDPLPVAEKWAQDATNQRQIMQWWQQWINSLIRWQQAGIADQEAEIAQKLRQIVDKVDCQRLFVFSDQLAGALSGLTSGLNRQLLLEDLLIDWAGLLLKR
ncbi:DNA polymerase III delta prime subunit [hydrothermal vent metagenome]|uniref:DNA polymerase III subunit delta' n=1 Tax=hydrothermal vent metagenome TaxID=652676 RepID=A0A3B0YZF8_9ZZZZ